MNRKDFTFAVQLSNTMNWNMTIDDFELATALEPEGCFILLQDSERLGIATTVSFGKVGWFGNLIVREEYRKRGAGSFLLRHALDYLKGAGVETVGLYAYPHLIKFYESFGFKVDEEFLELHGKPLPRTASETSRKIQRQDVDAVIDFDSQCFGACRTKLLEHIFREKKNLCYFSADEGGVKGYVAAKVFDGMAEVGPLVCHRKHVDAAVMLLEAVLSRLGELNVFMCVPAKETALLDWLSEAGFRSDFHVARMFLGPAVASNCLYVAESLERG
ncbi:MAG: GNAT family N-acetyltransferase [Candidatus Bathyarchaeota archaeon]|nr:GNAT family N-acetyltransferase [Candidatus Bathyarchaeota archaeon]